MASRLVADAIWQVIGLTAEELEQTLVFGGKCKFPSATWCSAGRCAERSRSSLITAGATTASSSRR
jgi:hypothetical protein